MTVSQITGLEFNNYYPTPTQQQAVKHLFKLNDSRTISIPEILQTLKELAGIEIKRKDILAWIRKEFVDMEIVHEYKLDGEDKPAFKLNTAQVYCILCWYDDKPSVYQKTYEFDKKEHLQTYHRWNDKDCERIGIDEQYSKEPIPEKPDKHDFEVLNLANGAISEQYKNQVIEVKCKSCGYVRTIWLNDNTISCGGETYRKWQEAEDKHKEAYEKRMSQLAGEIAQ